MCTIFLKTLAASFLEVSNRVKHQTVFTQIEKQILTLWYIHQSKRLCLGGISRSIAKFSHVCQASSKVNVALNTF